jgi:hypothetical protein
MLRRQVEDVESKLPPKVPVVVKVAPSPYQSCIYSWIKASGGLVCLRVVFCGRRLEPSPSLPSVCAAPSLLAEHAAANE